MNSTKKLLILLSYNLFFVSCLNDSSWQEAEPAVSIDRTAFTVESDKCEQSLTVTSNRSWKIEKDGNEDWFEISDSIHLNLSGITESTVIHIRFEDNISDQGRTASFRIVSGIGKQNVQLVQNPISLCSSWYYTKAIERLYSQPSASSIEKLITSMKSDGSWDDVDYTDTGDENWSPGTAGKRIRSLALFYHYTGNETCRTAALKALDYWFKVKPTSENWWNIEIYTPQFLGIPFIIFWNEFSEAQKTDALAIMDKATISGVAENKVNLCLNVMMKAILLKDTKLLVEARNAMLEVFKVEENGEGIQPDYSFHMHGHMLQTGNYGTGFLRNIIKAETIFRDTPLSVPEKTVQLGKKFAEEHLRWLIWNGYYDMNASARKLEKNFQSNRASTILEMMETLKVDEAPEGAKYYPYSDFGIYRARDWYASIRMQSNRLIGFECINEMNMKAYFSSDGALLVRRAGNEYYDVAPCWNWKHVPGVTSYDDGKPLWGVSVPSPYNVTDNVRGQVFEDMMIAAMELNRDGLTAKKVWFFFPKGILCLGCGITKNDDSEVVTTVEQNLLKTKITKGTDWILHNKVAYVMLPGTTAEVIDEVHTGSWKPIDPGYTDDPVSMNLFEAVISHGKKPDNASYGYVIIPNSDNGENASAYVSKSVSIEANGTDIQKFTANNYMVTVDWTSGQFSFEKLKPSGAAFEGIGNEGYSNNNHFTW